ncbi:hypothetical protein B0H14DRAFT_2697196 [Mycena olivaceomarginata]|nr:hypothetical protein B0H14DRAFT_2697196 [Mycena olivaceomarginata]
MRLVWLTLALLLPVSAVRINHTIDDTDPRVNYLPSAATALACHGCQDSASMSHYGLNASQLFNRTFSAFLWFSVDGSAIELNFTGASRPRQVARFVAKPTISEASICIPSSQPQLWNF